MFIAFVLVALKFTSYRFVHLYNLSKFLFSSRIDSSGLSTVVFRVSSANSFTPHETSFTMSFTYMRNKRGPSTDPCGTPASIAPQSDY